MSINLISGEITAQQIERFEALMTEMEALFANVLIGLAVEDRRTYGVMGDRIRVFAGHAQALGVYAFAKVTTPNAGVEVLVREMKQLFKRTRRTAATEETTA